MMIGSWKIAWRAPLLSASLVLGLLGLLAGCGGAAQPSAASEDAEVSSGGESPSVTAGMADGESMEEGGSMEATTSMGTAESETVEDYEDEVMQLVGGFDDALSLSTPDCGRADGLADAICDLADRVCDIADEHPEHSDVEQQCDDGRERCESARERVEARCE